jgi:endoglucanase
MVLVLPFFNELLLSKLFTFNYLILYYENFNYMKKILLLFSLLYLNATYSQIIYSDDFDSGVNNTTFPMSYTTSLVSQNLRIVGNGTAGAYAAISYNLHNSGTPTTINLSTGKLYIKVKATGSPALRIDLEDNLGYVTNKDASTISLSSNYAIYEIDYTGKFSDGGYGGSCSPGPCIVDKSKIKKIVFFINDAAGKYNGTVDIDWISFGKPLEALDTPTSKILYNQVGYSVGRDKFFNISSNASFTGIDYKVKNSANEIIVSATSPASSLWANAQQNVATIDLSSIDAPGQYTITTANDQAIFTVANYPYEYLANKAFKYFYYNRASTAIAAEFGGDWARATGIPDNSVLVHSSAASTNRPTGTVISAPKGWYDAGDYNKYVVNSGISTYTLLAAFEQYKSYYETKNFNIPESTNTLPDILDEVVWNLDWMLAMQDKVANGGDGGVYHKLTELNFSGSVMPAAYNSKRYVVKKSTSAALNFAAVTAIASRIYANYSVQKPGYSAALLTASKEAYKWAKNNPTVYYDNPSDVKTGVYGDTNVTDEFQWAAIELFITTNEVGYKNDINSSSLNGSIPSWPNTGTLGLISIIHNATALATKIDVPLFSAKLISTANQIKNTVNTSLMKISMSTNDYVWGSNGTTANQILVLINAYESTNDDSYLKAAYIATDYLLGRNGAGKCFVTGFGSNPVMSPHHRISEADNVTLPVPGMLAGGPLANAASIDGCSYPNNYAASSYSDSTCSYSTNEVTINWNAPLVYIINALQYYQDQSNLSTPDNLKPINEIVFFPNPVNSELNIKRNNKLSGNLTIVIYDIQGKKVDKRTLNDDETKINIESLLNGIYFVKVSSEGYSKTEKIIKN